MGYPSLMPSFEGNLLTQWHQITSLETRDSRLSYGEDQESLSHLDLNPYRVVTDGQTDRIAIANTRSQQYLTVQLSRVKTHIVYHVMSYHVRLTAAQSVVCIQTVTEPAHVQLVVLVSVVSLYSGCLGCVPSGTCLHARRVLHRADVHQPLLYTAHLQ